MSQAPNRHGSPGPNGEPVRGQIVPAGQEPRAPQPWALTRGLVHGLDNLVGVPGTNARVGLDPLIGLVPGLGDIVGAVVGGVIMADAVRHRVPLPVIARMAAQLGIDAVLGMIPVIGDLGDVAYRSNSRNYRLLVRAMNERELAAKDSKTYLLVAVGIVVASLVALLLAAGFALWLLVKLLGG